MSNNNKGIGCDKVPRGLRSLPAAAAAPKAALSNQQFASELQQEAAAVEQWWTQPRWQHTRRVYSGMCLRSLGSVCVFSG
jgi:hypothetical protein